MSVKSPELGSGCTRRRECQRWLTPWCPGGHLPRLFKIAWDLAGDAFGTRQLQERYYVGDPVRILARTFLAYDRTECQELVDYALALAGDPEPST